MKHFIRSLCGLTLLTSPGLAQPAVIRLTLGGGSATDLRGVRSGAYVIAPSATLFPHSAVRLSLGARGIRFTSREWAIAGSASADARLPLASALAIVLDVSGDLTRASYRATYIQVEAIPALEARLGAFTAWAGARGADARTTLQAGSALPLPEAPGAGDYQRSSVGPAFGASIAIRSFGSQTEVRLAYREEHGSPEGGRVVDRVATATLARGRLAMSGTVGGRRAPGEDRLYGGARVAIAVTRSMELFGGAETYPSNPLLNSPGGRSISAGLSLRTVGGMTPNAGPRPAAVPYPAPGLTRLSIRAVKAECVEVAGDWNQWRPVVLARASNGVWYADLSIPPGEYRYAFRIDGKKWDVPKGVAAVNDGFGGRSAWLSVRKPERKS